MQSNRRNRRAAVPHHCTKRKVTSTYNYKSTSHELQQHEHHSLNVHFKPQLPTLFTDVFPRDLNPEVTVPNKTLASAHHAPIMKPLSKSLLDILIQNPGPVWTTSCRACVGLQVQTEIFKVVGCKMCSLLVANTASYLNSALHQYTFSTSAPGSGLMFNQIRVQHYVVMASHSLWDINTSLQRTAQSSSHCSFQDILINCIS